MTRYLTFAALLFLLNSCILKQIDYPYAENNTTEQHFFGAILKDDYKWLEIDLPTNEKRTEWLDAQYKLSEHNVNRNRNKQIYDRITELGNITYTLNAGIIGDEIYYLKINLYRKQASLHKYSRFEDKRVLVNTFDFPFHLRTTSLVKVSPDGKNLAVVVEKTKDKFELFIYDALDKGSKVLTSIPFVKDYHVRWTPDSKYLFFIKDGINDANDEMNSYYVCGVSTNGMSQEIKKFITPDTGSLFNSIGYVYDDIRSELYITEQTYRSDNKINIYRTNACSPSSLHLWDTQIVDPDLQFKLAGIDSSNIYFFQFDNQIKGAFFAIKRENKKVDTIMPKSEDSFSGFSMIKDHILIGYKSKEDQKHEAYIINNKTYEKKQIGISKKGRYRFLNNPNDSIIYFNHESHAEPRALYRSSANLPDKHVRLCHLEDIPYNTNDFITEYPVIKSNNGNDIPLSISYRKGLKKDGLNPALLLAYLNGSDELKNSFYFSRILFMEQGFIFVQRNDVDNLHSIPLAQRAEDIKTICDYLISNSYTSRENLCLSGRQYGCTAIAMILNEKPDFCKTSIMVDGVFDLVNYGHAENMMYSIGNKSEFERTLNASPYHHIKNKACYPSIILLTSESNPLIAPWQTHKYAARLQMRTKGCNPILLYQPEKRWISDSYEITDFFDSIYQTISFLSNEMDVDLSPANYSKPESQSI